ncbi:MAG: DUF481 domain-containing protein [Flavobacteriales bacterium]
MMLTNIRVLLLVVFPVFTATVEAQIVNVESQRPGATDDGWHANINLNLSFQRNTTDILTYGNKSMVQWQQNRNRLLLLTDLNRVQAAGADFVNQGYLHARYNYHLDQKKRFSIEAFQQLQFNTVQLIELRYLAGVGPSWNVIEHDSLKFRVGSLPMYEYEELTTDAIERNIRQSTYLLFFIDFGFCEFQTINYYQPKWGQWSDYRLSSANTLEFTIRTWLKYNVSFNLLMDSGVPAGIPELVFTFRNGLGVEF